jgi:hypothetical protein
MKFKLIAFVVAGLVTTAVQADMFGFSTITTNAPNREAIADQLYMDAVTVDAFSSSVMFTNVGPASSSISEIYFGTDLTTLDLNIQGWSSCSPGVVFDISGASPPNPPGYQDFSFWWSVTVASAESQEPGSQNGINPYECLMLDLSYTSGSTFSELLQSGEVQVALHVVDIGENSDTFVNTTTIIPEPASAMLIGVSLSLGIFIRRRVMTD